MDTQALFSLEGRTALITGGSRGIGLMIAKGFIAQGAKVYISSRKADCVMRSQLNWAKTAFHCPWTCPPLKAVKH